MAYPSAGERFAAAAAAMGLDIDVRRFPQGTRTAVEAAAAVGCELGQIVKSLVFECDGEPVLVLTSGANRVDTAALGPDIGRLGHQGRRRHREASHGLCDWRDAAVRPCPTPANRCRRQPAEVRPRVGRGRDAPTPSSRSAAGISPGALEATSQPSRPMRRGRDAQTAGGVSRPVEALCDYLLALAVGRLAFLADAGEDAGRLDCESRCAGRGHGVGSCGGGGSG